MSSEIDVEGEGGRPCDAWEVVRACGCACQARSTGMQRRWPLQATGRSGEQSAQRWRLKQWVQATLKIKDVTRFAGAGRSLSTPIVLRNVDTGQRTMSSRTYIPTEDLYALYDVMCQAAICLFLAPLTAGWTWLRVNCKEAIASGWCGLSPKSLSSSSPRFQMMKCLLLLFTHLLMASASVKKVAAMLGPKTEEDMKPVEKKKAPKAPKVCMHWAEAPAKAKEQAAAPTDGVSAHKGRARPCTLSLKSLAAEKLRHEEEGKSLGSNAPKAPFLGCCPGQVKGCTLISQ
eukprot:scaffold216938_cov18-Tisochrysis_lutea.AAC.2